MRLLLAGLLWCAAAFAQCTTATIPTCPVSSGTNTSQVKPIAVPTSATQVGLGIDAYLQSVTVTNSSAGSLNFSLCDRQASPICAIAIAPIAAYTTYVIVWPVLYWCPSGFTVLASSSGLTFTAVYRQ